MCAPISSGVPGGWPQAAPGTGAQAFSCLPRRSSVARRGPWPRGLGQARVLPAEGGRAVRTHPELTHLPAVHQLPLLLRGDGVGQFLEEKDRPRAAVRSRGRAPADGGQMLGAGLGLPRPCGRAQCREDKPLSAARLPRALSKGARHAGPRESRGQGTLGRGAGSESGASGCRPRLPSPHPRGLGWALRPWRGVGGGSPLRGAACFAAAPPVPPALEPLRPRRPRPGLTAEHRGVRGGRGGRPGPGCPRSRETRGCAGLSFQGGRRGGEKRCPGDRPRRPRPRGLARAAARPLQPEERA